MKFNILLVLASFAVQIMTAKKLRTSFPAFCMPVAASQKINMRNIANSNTNAVAVNGGGFCGDSNAFAQGASGNYNQVVQSAAPSSF